MMLGRGFFFIPHTNRIQTAYKDRHVAFHTVITNHNLQDGKSVEMPTFLNLQTVCQTKPKNHQI